MANPTPVTVENLIDVTADINLFNDGIKTQLVSPRNLGTQRVTVKVKDDPLAVPYISSTANANVLNSVSDSLATFETLGVEVGDSVVALVSGLSANVTAVVSETVLTLDADILPLGTETYKVIPATFWTQRMGLGEWKQAGSKTGNNKGVSYTLPVNTATVIVDQVVYPIALAAIGTYPPITSAETA